MGASQRGESWIAAERNKRRTKADAQRYGAAPIAGRTAKVSGRCVAVSSELVALQRYFMRSVMIAVLAGVLIGCCRGQQPMTSVKAKPHPMPAHSGSGRRLTYHESGLVRVPDQLHVYRVGRLPDGDSMRDAGNYYHVEQSAYWNRFNPSRRQVVISGACVASGTSASQCDR